MQSIFFGVIHQKNSEATGTAAQSVDSINILFYRSFVEPRYLDAVWSVTANCANYALR
jgi:hypothetical protein